VVDSYPKVHKIHHNYFILAKKVEVVGKSELQFEKVK
jgi:hypothetical protein